MRSGSRGSFASYLRGDASVEEAIAKDAAWSSREELVKASSDERPLGWLLRAVNERVHGLLQLNHGLCRSGRRACIWC